MADDRNNDRSAIQMGAEASRRAVRATKAAAKASSGDYVGAAGEVLKDEKTRKAILAIILIPIILFVSVCTVFLYALPTAIFEAVTTFFSDMVEQMAVDTYSGQYGNAVLSRFYAVKNAIVGTVTSAGRSVWNWFKGLFSGEGDSNKTATEDINNMTSNGQELLVTQNEDAEMETLQAKVDATLDKINSRMDEIEDSITGPIQGYCESMFNANYGSDYHYTYAGTNVSVFTSNVTDAQAVRLLSAYTVVSGASLDDMKMSDFLKWLGYNPGYLFPRRARNTETIELGGTTASVPRWEGMCLPQYLYDQREYEINTFGREMSDITEELSCAALDMLIVVDCPDLWSVIPVIEPYIKTEAQERYIDVWVPEATPSPTPVQTPTRHGNYSTMPTPTPVPTNTGHWETQTEIEYVDVTYYDVSYNVAVNLELKDVDNLADYLGFVGTEAAENN